MTCTSNLLFENTLLTTTVYKGTKATHRLLELISQKNYNREQSLRVKDFLEGTGSVPDNVYRASETNSKQSWENNLIYHTKYLMHLNSF